LQFIANVIIGNDIDHLDYNILDGTDDQGGSDNQSQTNEPRLYEITSTNGIATFLNVTSMRNLFPRFASSTPLD